MKRITLAELKKAYREICDEECLGDRSVGIQPCPFYKEPDLYRGKWEKGGCRLEESK